MAKSKPRGAENTEHAAFIASAVRALSVEADGLGALSAALRDGLGGAFVAAADLIREKPGRVIVTGMGKSGHIARKIAATLASTGTPAFFIHAADAGHGDLGMIAPESDVILALSWSGETAELKSLIEYSRRNRPYFESHERPRYKRGPLHGDCWQCVWVRYECAGKIDYRIPAHHYPATAKHDSCGR